MDKSTFISHCQTKLSYPEVPCQPRRKLVPISLLFCERWENTWSREVLKSELSRADSNCFKCVFCWLKWVRGKYYSGPFWKQYLEQYAIIYRITDHRWFCTITLQKPNSSLELHKLGFLGNTARIKSMRLTWTVWAILLYSIPSILPALTLQYYTGHMDFFCNFRNHLNLLCYPKGLKITVMWSAHWKI